jgi:hypothetical protein
MHWSARILQILFWSIVSVASTMVSARADSLWNHNGSIMMLNANGNLVQFVYVQPKPLMAQQGVERGTVLFSGRRNGGGGLSDASYSGTASIFSAKCGRHDFPVKGTDLWDPFPKIRLEGRAPRINQQTCQQNGDREEILEFAYQLPPNLPGISETTCKTTDFNEYQECLEKGANAICRGRVQRADLERCFRHVAVLIYRNTGIGGYARDLAEGAFAPFTDCKSGFCKFSGGGSDYTCTRVSAASIRECNGENCSDISCPIRQCTWICDSK